MIHSCAGGIVADNKKMDFAKVEVLADGKVCWYVTNIPLLKEGDFVSVPYGVLDTPTKAKVIRVDKNVSNQVAPISVSKAKEIYGIWSE